MIESDKVGKTGFQIPSGFPALFLVCAVLLSAPMLPLYWSDNEINYFDLAFRFVRPELFGDANAVFDSSNARFLSFWIIGSSIDNFGFEASKVIFAVASIGLYAVAISLLSVSLRVDLISIAVILIIYVGHQSLLGGEWLFGTSEAKIFAYVCVIISIAAAAQARWTVALMFSVAGTAFHFLVGGFWGFALILLHALSTRNWRNSLKKLAFFVVLISPIIFLLAIERLGSEVDMTGINLTLGEIYATFRAPHHVAPFSEGVARFAMEWFPGLVAHCALAVSIFCMRSAYGVRSAFAVWVSGLNVYIVVAMIVAFIDRNTHFLAPLYLFRPSGLIFLLSIFMIVNRIALAIPTDVYRRLSLPAFIIIAGFSLPDVTVQAARIAVAGPIDRRVEATMDDAQLDVLDWLRENTSKGSVVLVQPPASGLSEGGAFPAALERLTPASYYVNFKWVPTAPADLAEWYRRLEQRRSVFDDGCAVLSKLPANFLLARQSFPQSLLGACAEVVYRNEAYVIMQVNK